MNGFAEQPRSQGGQPESGSAPSAELAAHEVRLARLTDRNDRLAETLREARDQMVSLKEEIDRLSAPPSGYGVFLESFDDDTVDIFTSGRKLRVAVSPEVEIGGLRRGQEVMLNEAMNVVAARDFELVGEVVTLIRAFADSDRALVVGHNDEERVVHLAGVLREAPLRPGDPLLLDSRSSLAYEKLPWHGAEGLVRDEAATVAFADIGGLDSEIQLIRDAVELPAIHRQLFRDIDASPPTGIMLFGPPGCGKTMLVRALANSLTDSARAGSIQGAQLLTIHGPQLLDKYVGETERNIHLVFQRVQERAAEGAPVIAFFDNMEALFGTGRSGGNAELDRSITPQLLHEVDVVAANENVVLFGASARVDLIDPAFLQPGRFDVPIEIGRPDAVRARDILAKHLTLRLPYDVSPGLPAGGEPREAFVGRIIELIFAESPVGLDLAEVTFEDGTRERIGISSLMSGALLRDVVNQAKRRSVKRASLSGRLELRLDDLSDALFEVAQQARHLLSLSTFQDWARLAGIRGQPIRFVRALTADGTAGPAIDRLNTYVRRVM